MSTKVISAKNLPARLPINSTVVFYLLMDNLNASPVAWGVGITLVVILWIAAITAICTQEHVDVIKGR